MWKTIWNMDRDCNLSNHNNVVIYKAFPSYYIQCMITKYKSTYFNFLQ